ncbi:hypothetical protein RJZ56_006378 [Blastomyces dermatitidis]
MFNQYIQRLGRNVGLEAPLTPYCIRRGIANVVDDVATTAEWNQVLGHSRADIFERYYMSQKVKRDIQSAYLGCPARASVIRAVGKMKYGSVAKARGTDLYAQYSKLGRIIQSERRFLRQLARKKIREQFFATIDTIEIERQLLGSPTTDDLEIKDGGVQFTFAERSLLASNLFRPLGCGKDAQNEIYNHQLQVISDWAALCSLQGVPCKRRASSYGLIAPKMEVDDPTDADADVFPIVCPATQCLFCLGNNQLAYDTRTYSFSRTDHLQRHVRDTHLRYLAADAKFLCPHPACLERVQGVMHFKTLTALIHKVYL